MEEERDGYHFHRFISCLDVKQWGRREESVEKVDTAHK